MEDKWNLCINRWIKQEELYLCNTSYGIYTLWFVLLQNNNLLTLKKLVPNESKVI